MSKIAPGRNIKQDRLLRSITDNLSGEGTRFAFLLGAGASRSSGIGTAAELASKWVKQLKEDDPEAFLGLRINNSYDSSELAKCYRAIYQARFGHNPADGYHELESIITAPSVELSLGYIMLANLMLETANDLVLTVNFDRLVETALLTVFNHHAKVVFHENMLPIIRLPNRQPTVVKTHKDIFYQPINEDRDIGALSSAWKKKINEILAVYHLIVLGYGGNDGEGLMQHLIDAVDSDRVYWCYRQEDDIPKAVIKQEYFCIKIDGFDEFMFALNEKLPQAKASNLDIIKERIQKAAGARVKRLDERVNAISEQNKGTESKPALADIQNFVANTWWDIERKVRETIDIESKDALYKEGLKKFTKSAELMESYAIFLKNIRKDHDQAERYYKKALDLVPNEAVYNGNYATFLMDIRKDHDQAEQYYKKALELDPNDARTNSNYGSFLHGSSKDHDQAEQYYKKALELDPNYVYAYGNYAGFLLAQGRKQEALAYLEKAEKLSNIGQLNLELAFYRLANFPDSYANSKARILKLLADGIRSVGWDFAANIARAERDGCEYIDELRELAVRITTA